MTPDRFQAIRDRLAAATRKPIPSCPGYEADDAGLIWSVAQNWRGYGPRPLVTAPDRNGYPKVRVQRGERWAHVDRP